MFGTSCSLSSFATSSLLASALIFSVGCSGGGGSVSGDNSNGDTGGSASGSTIGTATPVVPPGGGGGGGGSDAPSPGSPPGDPTTGGSGGGGGGGGGASGGQDASVSLDPGATSGVTRRDTELFSGRSDSAGISNLALSVANTVSFQVVTESNDGSLYVGTLELLDPASGIALDSDDNNPPFTTALSFDTKINSLPYPTKENDPEVSDGTYSQQIGIGVLSNGNSIAGVSEDYSGVAIGKNDTNLNSGSVAINVFYFGNEAQQGSNRVAVAAAIDIWRNIYSASRSITLDVNEFDVSGTGILPIPVVGSSFYLTNITGAGVPSPAVNVFIGEDISADGTTIPGNPLGALGIAPAIPGPAVPTTKSAVAVSLIEHQGGDGAFTTEEVDILGETLAHEVGHYLGLFHPVEFNFLTGGFSEGDRLIDTTTCSTTTDCIAQGTALNNMFPTPVTGVTQRTLTSEQRGVMNLQVIVD